MGRPRGRSTPGVQEPDVHRRSGCGPSRRPAGLAWRRLWQLLLPGDPATPAPDEPPSIMADETGTQETR